MRGQKSSYKPPHGQLRGPGDPVTSDRAPVNKRQSAREFRDNTARSRAANFELGPMRGGWRL